MSLEVHVSTSVSQTRKLELKEGRGPGLRPRFAPPMASPLDHAAFVTAQALLHHLSNLSNVLPWPKLLTPQYTHTHLRTQWKQHSIVSYLPFSGFPCPVRARGESCPGGIWGLSSSWSHLHPSLPLLRLIPPSSPPPPPIPANWLPGQPSWEAASYHGNPAWLPGCLA